MDEVVRHVGKFLSNTMVVRIFSHPPLSVEIILSTVICVVQLLLIFEINALMRRKKAAEKMRTKNPLADVSNCSTDSLIPLQNSMLKEKADAAYQKPFYIPFEHILLQRNLSATSNFGWLLSHGDSTLRNNLNFLDRVEQMLSISPCEYVKRDKEKKIKEAGLRSCLRSLTSLLQKALDNENLDLQNISKAEIKKSINALRENFESRLSDTYIIRDFPSASLQSLIAKSTAKNSLHSPLPLIPSDMKFSSSSFDIVSKENENNEERNRVDSARNIVLKKSESLSEIFRKKQRILL